MIPEVKGTLTVLYGSRRSVPRIVGIVSQMETDK